MLLRENRFADSFRRAGSSVQQRFLVSNHEACGLPIDAKDYQYRIYAIGPENNKNKHVTHKRVLRDSEIIARFLAKEVLS